jgi:murein DD-endopeptidase MepM/ murein hydrolase activator NlpD
MTKIYELVVTKPKITSKFAYRIHPITKKKAFHYGLDLVSKTKDTCLYAIDSGYVQKVVTGQDKSTTGFGNYVWVRYPRYDLSLLYAHCKTIRVKKGDSVYKGKIVAIMGSTGASTGTHLHLGVTKIGSNAWLNPESYDVIPDKYNLTRTLKKGSKGNDVKELQKKLNISVDGIFGNNTKNAVKKFQKANKLTQDGAVGKNTAHKLGWLYKNA